MTRPGDDERTGRRLDGRRWLAVVLVLYGVHVAFLSGLAEDAFISFRFARHLASGHGLTWNVGQPPVEGFTNFLWVLLSAGWVAAGLNVARMAQAVGIACGAGTLALVYWAARRDGWPGHAAVIPAAMLAAAGPFAAWATSGMETVPFALAVTSALALFAAHVRDGRRSTLVGMSLSALAATLLRPEGLIVFIVLAGLAAVLDSAAPGRSRQPADHLAGAIAYLLPFLAYTAWRLWYFGDLLPNTYYAKTGGGLVQVARGAVFAAGFLLQFVAPLVPWAMVAAWESSGRTVTRAVGPAFASWRRHALAIGGVALFAAFTADIVAVGGDYMAMHRFFVPVLPALYLAAGSALATLDIDATRARHRAFALLVGLAVCATLLPSMPFESRLFFRSVHQHGNYRGVQVERWSVARLSVIGRFFDRYRTSPAESLATDAIGAIGFYADMPIHDVLGLVDRHIARQPISARQAQGMPGHQKSDFRYILSLRPTFLMFSRMLTLQPTDGRADVPDEIRTDVERDYEPRSVWIDDRENGESGYFTFLQRRGRGSVY